ncbi:unnamed protein product [Lactuca saligna]|uniref:Protein SPA, chloroplastic n=1 Tax=Lactuca saligna TaxID=75948 RepID=A0AA35ZZT1_LACSI|nr:unnamed protein product [Lactuca saligna]
MSSATSLRSPFLSPSSPSKLSSSSSSHFHSLSFKCSRNQRSPASYPHLIKAELDQNTVVAVAVGVMSVAAGIGLPIFYESQIDNAAKRDNTQPCFPCSGTGSQSCRFCTGSGNVTVALGGGENEVSRCINCDGAGSLTCTTCQGSGIQPRYLDRREFKDDD